MRNISKVSFVLGLAAALVGCGGGGHGTLPTNPANPVTPATPTVASIAVTSQNASIPVGLTQQFVATGTYTNGSTKDLTTSVTWSSSAANIVSVNSSGLATGVAQGSATIKAVLNSVNGNLSVNITPAIAQSIGVTPQTPSIPLGTSQQFKAMAAMSDGSQQDVTASVAWSSSAQNIVSIDSKGLASGKAQGNVTITAVLNSLSTSASLSVGAAALTSIAVKPANGSMAQGTKQQFSATGTYTDGSKQDLTSAVAWSSTDTNIAAIDSAGMCSAKGQGSASVHAILNSVSGSTGVKVTPASLVNIVVGGPNSGLPIGLNTQLTATGIFTDNSTQNITAAVTWLSSDATTVSVSASGLAHALKSGNVTVSATLNSVTGHFSVSATAAVLTGIKAGPATISLAAGSKLHLTATGVFSDGSTSILSTGVTWGSSAHATATVDNNGVLIALTAGNANITATVGLISANVSLTVTPAVLTSLVVTPSISSIGIDANLKFTATGVFSDDTVEDLTDAVHWATSNAGLCVISNIAGSTGLATTVAAGNVSVTATLNSISGSAAITVNHAKLVSLHLDATNLSLALGTTLKLAAIGDFDDGSSEDITANVTWSSDNAGVSVDADGLLTALTANTSANIKASLGGINGTVAVKVPLALSFITINANALSLGLGMSLQLQAIGHFNDGSTADLTASVTWSSGNAAGIVVGPSGLATALSLGPVTVKAQLGSTTGTLTLTATNAVLVSISVTPNNGVLSLLSPLLQFKATGHFSDGSTQDLTAQVQWSSNNNLLVVISNVLGKCGLATHVGIGDVTISAKLNGITGSVTLQSIL